MSGRERGADTDMGNQQRHENIENPSRLSPLGRARGSFSTGLSEGIHRAAYDDMSAKKQYDAPSSSNDDRK